jgi:hypothetical protein
MSATLEEACLSVAAEIEAGTLVPGCGARTDAGKPCCTVGHLEARTGRRLWVPMNHYDGLLGPVAFANDRGDWPEVVRLLRSIAAVQP